MVVGVKDLLRAYAVQAGGVYSAVHIRTEQTTDLHLQADGNNLQHHAKHTIQSRGAA
jgi:hypothetical protein